MHCTTNHGVSLKPAQGLWQFIVQQQFILNYNTRDLMINKVTSCWLGLNHRKSLSIDKWLTLQVLVWWQYCVAGPCVVAILWLQKMMKDMKRNQLKVLKVDTCNIMCEIMKIEKYRKHRWRNWTIRQRLNRDSGTNGNIIKAIYQCCFIISDDINDVFIALRIKDIEHRIYHQLRSYHHWCHTYFCSHSSLKALMEKDSSILSE